MVVAVVCGEFLAPPMQDDGQAAEGAQQVLQHQLREPRRRLGARRQPADQRDAAVGPHRVRRHAHLRADTRITSWPRWRRRAHRRAWSRTAAGSCRATRPRASAARTSRPSARQAACSSRRSAAISSGSPWCSRASSRPACLWALMHHLKDNGLDATDAGVRLLVAHRAHHRHPVRRLAGGAVRVRQPAFRRIRRAPADRRADRRFVLLRAAHARERRDRVQGQPDGAGVASRAALLRQSRWR